MDKESMKWNIIQHKKENSAIWDNMDEPGGYNTKWNKPDRERQVLYDLTKCGI